MIPTYAIGASPAFNHRMHEALAAIAADVRSALGPNLVALVLGGGYGRGEGAAVPGDVIETPYNDLDFVIIVKQAWAVSTEALARVSARHEAALGIEVDFSRPLTESELPRLPHWLMWQDLVNGHVVVDGPQDVLTASAPNELLQPLPAIEATRLLINRGAGLLQAILVAKGLQGAPDRDFVRRNYQKCQLAMGDAVLIAHRCFQTPYTGRDSLLQSLAGRVASVSALGLGQSYDEALAFKFAPGEPPSDPSQEPDLGVLLALVDRWSEVFLHVERRRVGLPWADLKAYTAWPGLREPELHKGLNLLRNLMQNLRRQRVSWRYAREGLYRELPALLIDAKTPSTDWPERSLALLKVWRQFN